MTEHLEPYPFFVESCTLLNERITDVSEPKEFNEDLNKKRMAIVYSLRDQSNGTMSFIEIGETMGMIKPKNASNLFYRAEMLKACGDETLTFYINIIKKNITLLYEQRIAV
jgi:hypothetical protein